MNSKIHVILNAVTLVQLGNLFGISEKDILKVRMVHNGI